MKCPRNIPIAKIANSDSVHIGDQVFIIGAPYGLSHSLSIGHISGRHLEKNKTSGFVWTEFFQTDAAINQGNSGGPMFNIKGEVIGIVSYIITESGGFQGLGFAATSNLTRTLLFEQGSPYLGIDGHFLNSELAALLNVPQSGGLLVQKVVDLSPADIAGVKGGYQSLTFDEEEIILGGDIILEVLGVKLDSRDAIELLRDRFSEKGKTKNPIPIKLLREGRIKEVQFSL